MAKSWTHICARFGGMFAALAMIVTAMTVNATCIYLTHQDELPQNAKKLRRF